MTPFGAPSLKNKSSCLGRHSRSEAMRLGASPVVGLKRSLGHSRKSPNKKKTVRLAVTGPSVKKGTPVTIGDLQCVSSDSESRYVFQDGR